MLLADSSSDDLSLPHKMLIAGIGGAMGVVAGNPADMSNIRMQNDVKLGVCERRNYKNCFDAIYRIGKEEGVLALYSGFRVAVLRAVLVTIGKRYKSSSSHH